MIQQDILFISKLSNAVLLSAYSSNISSHYPMSQIPTAAWHLRSRPPSIMDQEDTPLPRSDCRTSAGTFSTHSSIVAVPTIMVTIKPIFTHRCHSCIRISTSNCRSLVSDSITHEYVYFSFHCISHNTHQLVIL